MSTRRRIALVTPRFGRGHGGVGTSAERVVEHLRSAHDVEVFELSPELPRATVREIAPGHVQIATSDTPKASMQFLVDVLEERARGAVLAGFYAGATASPLWLASRWLSAPLLLFARGNDVDLEPFGKDGPALLAAWAGADGVVCVTRELERKVRAWAPSARTRYVPNGVDVEPFTEGYAPAPLGGERLRVGVLGEVKAKKGLEQLLTELDVERFELEIIGAVHGDTEKLLHGTLMLRPELAERVHYTPMVTSREELLACYARLDLVCLPSLHEGMANVMLEAMALGKTVVASAVGGALDVIEDGVDGVLFPRWREGALAAALARAADLDREALGARAAQTIRERFHADRERSALLAAIDELLDSRR